MDEFTRLGKVQIPESDSKLQLLTYRELEVLRLLGTGASNREISERLNITENTVKSHVHNVLDKLNMRNRSEARNFAQRLGLSGYSFQRVDMRL
jgi:DNA-binding NarL/FixJ family response regulator